MVTRNRTSSSNSHHRRRHKSRRERVEPAALSFVRLTAGAISLGWQELERRLDAVPARERDSKIAAKDLDGSTAEYLAVGLAVELADVLARVAQTAIGYGRTTLATVEYVAGLPVVKLGTDPVRRRMDSASKARRRVIQRGRRERAEGRRMVRHVVQHTASQGVKDIAETAVHEVSSSPEIAALVRTQSAGMATDTIHAVRTTSEEADERLERRVHSWFNRKPVTNEQDRPEPPTAA